MRLLFIKRLAHKIKMITKCKTFQNVLSIIWIQKLTLEDFKF